MYKIKLENFEGPLDLLLELIEKRQLDITQVSLAKVADDYLEFIEQEREIDLANLSEFLLIASQLILLKSKALLPIFEFTKEEEEEFQDLEIRLKEYQELKKAAEEIEKMIFGSQKSFSRENIDFEIKHFSPPEISINDLKKALMKVIAAMPTKEELESQLMKEVINIEEKISFLKDSLEKRMTLAFHETVKSAKDKIEIIVTFLAMLEMIKQKIILVEQKKLFGEIWINSAKSRDSQET